MLLAAVCGIHALHVRGSVRVACVSACRYASEYLCECGNVRLVVLWLGLEDDGITPGADADPLDGDAREVLDVLHVVAGGEGQVLPLPHLGDVALPPRERLVLDLQGNVYGCRGQLRSLRVKRFGLSRHCHPGSVSYST